MTMSPHIAPHSRGKNKLDQIFVRSGMAKAAISKFGAENVIDSTIGALLDNQSRLALLSSVGEAERRLTSGEISPYAPAGGLPEFKQDVIDYLYEGVENRPALGAVATPGATGALRLAIWDFLEAGDPVVTHDYFWAPYKNIVEDTDRRFETFPTFVDHTHFNVAGCLNKVEEVLADHQRVLLLVNTPGHNPTGLAIESGEIDKLSAGLKKMANANPEKIITFLVDGAYWEFGDPISNTNLLKAFADLPENMLYCMTYTISKSLTRYGLRTGALICGARSQKTVDDVVAVLGTSARVHWSNTCRMGQLLFSTLFRDKQLKAQLAQEQKEFSDLCLKRGAIFVAEAKEAGLLHTPFKGGFFLTIPSKNPVAIADALAEQKMFFVPLAKGVRVALCAIPTQKMSGLAARIAEVVNAAV